MKTYQDALTLLTLWC